MTHFDIIGVKFDKLNINKPYCIIIGFKIKNEFISNYMIFNTEEDFEKYCDILIDIFEPHERPNILFI